jgi:hypothetical protein
VAAGGGGLNTRIIVPTWEQLLPSVEEIERARTAPRCIVENYLYADLAIYAAAGGTGKTTIVLYEDMCIALGLPLWGNKILHPGPTLFITSEDRREFLLGRRREIIKAMEFTDEQKEFVRQNCRIWDVVGEQLKLIRSDNGNIVLTEMVDQIVEAYRGNQPAVVTFDPLVSFGASESAVNDNEQRLVEAGRRVIKGLDCCTRYIHHVGKANAREKTTDQYSSRNGSALPDGGRMVFVLTPAASRKEGETAKDHHLPTNAALAEDETAVLLTRAKLSYVRPQPKIFIIRNGYAFRHIGPDPRSAEEIESARMDQICNFIAHKKTEGVFFTPSDFTDHWHDKLGITRSDLRVLVGRMLDMCRLFEARHPNPRGQRKTCLSVEPDPDPMPPKKERARRK